MYWRYHFAFGTRFNTKKKESKLFIEYAAYNFKCNYAFLSFSSIFFSLAILLTERRRKKNNFELAELSQNTYLFFHRKIMFPVEIVPFKLRYFHCHCCYLQYVYVYLCIMFNIFMHIAPIFASHAG